ncbi:MAG: xanthine dehydrogenase accessory protein XdhC [Alphaproteobacteria bacterium]
MTDWLRELTRLTEAGEPHVLVTVVEVKGSAPREAGAKMVVTADGQFGSVGGGNLEHKATLLARRMLREGCDAPALEHFPLGPSLGQCCGGHVSLLLEPFHAGHFHVVLFGAGHVGKAVVNVLAGLPCRVTWIDDRADQFPKSVPANVTTELSEALVYDVAEAPPGAYYLVMTHSHRLDRDLVEAILRRGDSAYCGLIGSRTKRRRFLSRLEAKGLSEEQLSRLTCPIGIPDIHGKRPAEIAVAVAAQLLQLHGQALEAKEKTEEALAEREETA